MTKALSPKTPHILNWQGASQRASSSIRKSGAVSVGAQMQRASLNPNARSFSIGGPARVGIRDQPSIARPLEVSIDATLSADGREMVLAPFEANAGRGRTADEFVVALDAPISLRFSLPTKSGPNRYEAQAYWSPERGNYIARDFKDTKRAKVVAYGHFDAQGALTHLTLKVRNNSCSELVVHAGTQGHLNESKISRPQ